MRRHHTGSGKRRVIPADWQHHHAPTIEATLASTVAIGPAAGTPAWNPATKQTETAAVPPVYDGPAAVQAVAAGLGGNTSKRVAEELVPHRSYEVTLPWDATTEVTTDHVVTVTADEDPDMVGRRFTINTIERGTRRFSRVLQATLIY
ncbi:DUF6093 family protein [Nocardioides speluncae]|uniref:DUF6093 family protein n=1 Tax=Nocardioides speluncae TaxID=2670337 RepID=UPI000D69CCE1|nr:DUF6093 family protein [Nocardioides speluncae]